MNWTWLHRLGSPAIFYRLAGRLQVPCLVLAGLLLAVGLAWGLFLAPPDYQQGDSFRIIYVHVPAAFLAQSCYLLLAIAGAIGLVWRLKLADVALRAAAPIGAWMTVIALATGSLWGIPTWGTWWIWDARLTSMLVLLFLYLGVIALGQAIDHRESAARACAILALVGSVNLPIIKYSVEWWSTLHQPATFSLVERPPMPAAMWLPLLVMVLAFYLFFAGVLLQRMRLEVLRREWRSRWVRLELGEEGA
ncbi:heme ABC transporter permease [Pseudomonas oryzihabitans]|uniref:heme ABC transporter permease n=1 Tax=Pseudomonas oryzihabitans TaxID=47885 RepID=UPI002897539F|nr:heme ABC transporter permease [Pseudomonas oryzihabitans]